MSHQAFFFSFGVASVGCLALLGQNLLTLRLCVVPVSHKFLGFQALLGPPRLETPPRLYVVPVVHEKGILQQRHAEPASQAIPGH